MSRARETDEAAASRWNVHGHARRLWLRPVGWDATLFLDGARQTRLPPLRAVAIEVAPTAAWPRIVHLLEEDAAPSAAQTL